MGTKKTETLGIYSTNLLNSWASPADLTIKLSPLLENIDLSEDVLQIVNNLLNTKGKVAVDSNQNS